MRKCPAQTRKRVRVRAVRGFKSPATRTRRHPDDRSPDRNEQHRVASGTFWTPDVLGARRLLVARSHRTSQFLTFEAQPGSVSPNRGDTGEAVGPRPQNDADDRSQTGGAARGAFTMIIISEPSAEATRPVRTSRYTSARLRSSTARNDTLRCADVRPISVHTGVLAGSRPTLRAG
jgi:hypothetical protein